MSYATQTECSVCGAVYPADRLMNLCPVDDRPVRIVLDLERLKAEHGKDGW